MENTNKKNEIKKIINSFMINPNFQTVKPILESPLLFNLTYVLIKKKKDLIKYIGGFYNLIEKYSIAEKNAKAYIKRELLSCDENISAWSRIYSEVDEELQVSIIKKIDAWDMNLLACYNDYGGNEQAIDNVIREKVFAIEQSLEQWIADYFKTSRTFTKKLILDKIYFLDISLKTLIKNYIHYMRNEALNEKMLKCIENVTSKLSFEELEEHYSNADSEVKRILRIRMSNSDAEKFNVWSLKQNKTKVRREKAKIKKQEKADIILLDDLSKDKKNFEDIVVLLKSDNKEIRLLAEQKILDFGMTLRSISSEINDISSKEKLFDLLVTKLLSFKESNEDWKFPYWSHRVYHIVLRKILDNEPNFEDANFVYEKAGSKKKLQALKSEAIEVMTEQLNS